MHKHGLEQHSDCMFEQQSQQADGHQLQLRLRLQLQQQLLLQLEVELRFQLRRQVLRHLLNLICM